MHNLFGGGPHQEGDREKHSDGDGSSVSSTLDSARVHLLGPVWVDLHLEVQRGRGLGSEGCAGHRSSPSANSRSGLDACESSGAVNSEEGSNEEGEKAVHFYKVTTKYICRL